MQVARSVSVGRADIAGVPCEGNFETHGREFGDPGEGILRPNQGNFETQWTAEVDRAAV